MTGVHAIMGEGPYGLPLMKFTLTYQGELRSNDDYKRKWEIRKRFDPQLQELWRVHPSLKSVEARRRLPNDGYVLMERHHSLPEISPNPPIVRSGYVDLLAPFDIKGRKFFPTVRNS